MRRRLLSLSLAAAAILCAQDGPPPGMKKGNRPPRKPRPGVSDPAVKHPMSDIKPEAVFDVPGVPDWLVVTEDAVWVSNKPKDSITRMNVKTNQVEATIPVGSKPCSGIIAGFGSIWVPNCGDKTLSRVDIKTNKVVATLPLGPAESEGGITMGFGSIWFPTDKGFIARINPKDNIVIAEIAVPEGTVSATVTKDAVWATSPKGDVLSRIDPKKNKVVAEIKVGEKPRFLTAGEGAVWTYDQTKGTITRVDAKTNQVVATIEAGLPGGGGEIHLAEGFLWVTAFEHPITKIDPKTNKVVGQWSGPGGDAIRAGHGSVWLSNLREHNVWRIKATDLK